MKLQTPLTRTEHDFLGELEIPADALYGIHTARALENFQLSGRSLNPALVKAYGWVKLACTQINRELGYFPESAKADAIEQACRELAEGSLNEWIKVDALQGGAGTSTNMNVNEVIANRALQILGKALGSYEIISPLDDINLHQSTNDTYPTALKLAAILELRNLEQAVLELQEDFQQKEKEFADVVKIGRTQLQDAVLTTLGREMAAYAEAFNRDRWRIYKCEERLRVVNLGGTAIGSGLGAPRQFIFRATDRLRELTNTSLARAENLMECTQNTDVFVEVSGILKACASNLFKVSNDLRLLSSGPDGGLGEINLPAMQAGSSIMPGKINPVIPESVAQAAMQVIANDQLLTQACMNGNLELNQFMPVVADSLLCSLQLLLKAASMLRLKCVTGITANREKCRKQVLNSTAAITALIPSLGYEKCSAIAEQATKQNLSIRELVLQQHLMDEQAFEQLICPEAVNKLGF
ncbi:aspartate ammonia-lyase [Mangrovibacterium diazotrophicum]|uniref:Aspartate ammonia-lyase n=1 Tax=Mangrovibacterium diazotrophicum TaxID=1261403 RepID=A0A419VWE6_9BACT|nr:aspartate ammonia-lyase [Mangrovibacterium diazotrophicum]RKD86322.1 aspartate ammonia-lyase [Mangrovibacterium diazotrophicum]